MVKSNGINFCIWGQVLTLMDGKYELWICKS